MASITLKKVRGNAVETALDLVVGDREAQNGTVSVRNRKHGDLGAKPVAEFLADLQKLIESKAVSE